MFCRRTQSVLVLHERTSRLAFGAKLAGKSAAETAATLMAIFKRLAPELEGSSTFDKPRQQASGSIPAKTEGRRPRRGSELARHGLLAPLAIWRQRQDHLSSRRLRQLAKGQRREHQWPAAKTATEVSRPRHLELGRSAGDRPFCLNLTQRKSFRYMSPIQAFFKGLGKNVQIKFARASCRCTPNRKPPGSRQPADPGVLVTPLGLLNRRTSSPNMIVCHGVV